MAGIYPVHEGASTRIATPSSPGAPRDPRPDLIVGLGAALERSTAQVSDAYRRRKELEDEAEVMRRYMLAVSDMEAAHEQLTVPENALKAKELFDTTITEREPSWYEGLSAGASQKLQQKLFPRTLEYRGGAGKIENRAKIQQYSATLVGAKTRFADVASRRIDPDDASETPEFQMFAEGVDAGVRAGLISPEAGAEEKDKALKQGAYSRAYKVTASTSQEEVQRLLDLYKKEDETRGSTFLKHIEPEKRISLQKQAQERLESLKAEEAKQARDARQDTERQLQEMQRSTNVMAAQKLGEPEKYGPLTREWIDLGAELGLLKSDEYTHYRNVIEKVAASGTSTGYGNPAVLNRYSTEVFTTRTPEDAQRVQQEVLHHLAVGNIPGGPGSIGSQWLNHLEEKARLGTKAPPTPAAQTNEVQELLRIRLKTGGLFDKFDRTANNVLGEAFEALAANARAGYPEPAMEIYNRNINNWMARAGTKGREVATELRRSQGIPNEDLKKIGTTDSLVEKQRRDLKKAYLAAPPGPEGDAERNALEKTATELEKLHSLEKEIRRLLNLREQATGAGQQSQSSSSPSSSSSAPAKKSGGPVPVGSKSKSK